MKQKLLFLLTSWLVASGAWAQTKVFKEVSEEISSQVSAIKQDNALVGYLAFTRLEKTSEDSFNYKITIMDENLNDIGTVNFREESIYMQGVAFEQDVLCLAYFKTNVFGKKFLGTKEYRNASSGFKNQIMLQFLGLDGKILKTNFINAAIKDKEVKISKKEVYADGKIKANTQLINIPQYGFACAFADDDKSLLSVYSASGERIWQKKLKADLSNNYPLVASGPDIYLILQSREKAEKDPLVVYSYRVKDSVEFPAYPLKDKKGHGIGVLSFENSGETGKPYITGYFTNPDRPFNYSVTSAKKVTKGVFSGFVTYNFNEHSKNGVKEQVSYWDDGSNSSISSKGRYGEQKLYLRPTFAFKDFTGNTIFLNNTFTRRTRWGSIASSVILSPLFFPSYFILLNGTQKVKPNKPVIVKMDPQGKLTYQTPIETKGFHYSNASNSISNIGRCEFQFVRNSETKTNYLIIRDWKNYTIYNLEKQKIERAFPDKGNIRIAPAKEGYIMVVEYNRAEKYTRVAIEAL